MQSIGKQMKVKKAMLLLHYKYNKIIEINDDHYVYSKKFARYLGSGLTDESSNPLRGIPIISSKEEYAQIEAQKYSSQSKTPIGNTSYYCLLRSLFTNGLSLGTCG